MKTVSGEKVVYVDVTSPYSGTDFPMGKIEAPVNNLKDARKIADRVGTKIIVNINEGKDIE